MSSRRVLSDECHRYRTGHCDEAFLRNLLISASAATIVGYINLSNYTINARVRTMTTHIHRRQSNHPTHTATHKATTPKGPKVASMGRGSQRNGLGFAEAERHCREGNRSRHPQRTGKGGQTRTHRIAHGCPQAKETTGHAAQMGRGSQRNGLGFAEAERHCRVGKQRRLL